MAGVRDWVVPALRRSGQYSHRGPTLPFYLPKDWVGDAERRKAAGVPENILFATKLEIALEQMRQAVASGVPMGVVLAVKFIQFYQHVPIIDPLRAIRTMVDYRARSNGRAFF